MLFYLRFFPSNAFRVLTWIGLAVTGATGITFIVGTILQCHPVSYFWDRSIKGGHCIRNAPWWQSYSAIQIATDVYILVLPIPSLASLSLKLRHKIALIGVFALGGLYAFSSHGFLSMLIPDIACALPPSSDLPHSPLQQARIGHVCLPKHFALSSLTWSLDDPIPATNWSVIEANVGLISACLPSLKPFLDNIVRTCLGQPPRMTTPNPYLRPKSSTARGYALGFISPNEALAHRQDWAERG